MDSFEASYNGQGFIYEDEIEAGHTIVINTLDKTVLQVLPVLASPDDNMYGALGTAPKLFPIPPGQAVIAIVAQNTDPSSLVSMYFNPRREVVFG